MSKGVLGMPLLKGKSEVIITAHVKGATTGITAGRAVFSTGTETNDQKDVQLAATALFAGVLSTDFKVSKTSSEGAIAGVLEQGLKVPVILKAAFTPTLGKQLGVNKDGEFTDAAASDTVLKVSGQWHSTEVLTAINEQGEEIRCGFVDLYGGTVETPAP